jgi:hypothetical protein
MPYFGDLLIEFGHMAFDFYEHLLTVPDFWRPFMIKASLFP